MAKDHITIDYDEENDILFIHSGFSKEEKFGGNLEIGNIVLDKATNGSIRGIEIFNASEFLSDFGVTDKFLSHLKNAKLNVTEGHHGFLVNLILRDEEKSIPVKIMLQQPKIISPLQS